MTMTKCQYIGCLSMNYSLLTRQNSFGMFSEIMNELDNQERCLQLRQVETKTEQINHDKVTI